MRAPKSPNEYLASIDPEARKTLETLRERIRKAVPEAEEGITYAMPGFKLHGKFLVAYAGFKDHCSFFPASGVIEKHAEELKGYSTSKGTIRFPIGKPLSAALVKKLVRSRVEEIEEARSKRSKK